jgi:hypothetical protein
MKIQHTILGATLLSGLLCGLALPAQALTMQECSAKYKAAKDAGTLGDKKWNDFRKSECAADPAAAKTDSTKTDAAKTDAAKTDTAKMAKPAAAPAAMPAAVGNAVFPTAVSSKYSSESAGKARMHTCVDQYNANKEKNENGGLKWIQKGGGYYSECTKRLKG